jgi:hypothetical protein
MLLLRVSTVEGLYPKVSSQCKKTRSSVINCSLWMVSVIISKGSQLKRRTKMKGVKKGMLLVPPVKLVKLI